MAFSCQKGFTIKVAYGIIIVAITIRRIKMVRDNNEGTKDTGISYVIMPIEVLKDDNLTPSEKILYCYLTLFKKQCCFQSNAGISNFTGLDESTIKRGIRKLAELKYIFVEFVNNNSAARRIYVIMDNPKKLEYLVTKGMFKAGKDSNVVEENDTEEPSNSGTVIPERPKRSDYATDDEFYKAVDNYRVRVV